MSKNINLLRSKRAKSFEQITKILWIIAGFSIFIVVASSIAVFFLKMQSQLPILQKTQNDLLAGLSASQTKVIKQVLFVDRLQNISNIISKRTAFDIQIGEILPQIPPAINVNSITIDKKNISMTLSTSSLAEVDTFTNNLKSMVDNEKLIKRVNFSGITFNQKKGEYSFSINADLL